MTVHAKYAFICEELDLGLFSMVLLLLENALCQKIDKNNDAVHENS